MRALAVILLCTVPGVPLAAQETTTDAAEDPPWYRVELLVLRHTAPSAASTEAWPPYPELTYPAHYRFLLDRAAADARLDRYPAATSEVDERGVQILRLTAPAPAPDPNTPLLSARERASIALEPIRPDGHVGAAPAGPDATEAPDPNAPPTLPPAFLRLEERELPTRRLANGPYEVLWHSAWLQPLMPADQALPLLLDQSGDPDGERTWPQLQGSVRLYLSRYLHLETDLWLNTEGSYLPAGWRGKTPPLAPPSLHVEVPTGFTLIDGRKGPLLLPALPASGLLADPPGEVPLLALDRPLSPLPAARDQEQSPVWPWRHSIALRAERRMRSGETHYIDHPLLGVIIRLEPLDSAALKVWGERLADPAWAARHGRAATEATPAGPDRAPPPTLR